jgi:hypothetical protein
MLSMYLLVKDKIIRYRISIICAALSVLITLSTLIIYSKRTVRSQTPGLDFSFEVNREQFDRNFCCNTPVYTIRNARPNTRIRWSLVHDGVERFHDTTWEAADPSCQLCTDANGNADIIGFTFQPGSATFGSFAPSDQGRWTVYATIGDATRKVDFLVYTELSVTTDKPEYELGERVHVFFKDLLPNAPFEVTCEKNGSVVPCTYYQNFATASTNYDFLEAPLTAADTGYWRRKFKIGNNHSTIEYSVNAPPVGSGTLRARLFASMARGETGFGIVSTALPENYFNHGLCECVRRYSILRGWAMERMMVASDYDITTWIRFRIVEAMSTKPLEYPIRDVPPPDLVSRLGPNEILIRFVGGSAEFSQPYYNGSTVAYRTGTITYTRSSDPSSFFESHIADVQSGNLNHFVVLLVNWDQAARKATIPLDDRNVFFAALNQTDAGTDYNLTSSCYQCSDDIFGILRQMNNGQPPPDGRAFQLSFFRAWFPTCLN